MTKITKSQKKFIKNNYKIIPLTVLARKTGLPEYEITSYIEKSGRDTEKIIDDKSNESMRVKFTSLKEIFWFLYSNRLIILGLAILVFLIYFNSLGGEFIADDILAFRDNPEVRDINASFQSLNIQKIIYALSFKFFGLNPVPLHVTIVVFHLIAVILVFIFSSVLFNKKTGFLAALIFAVSPINTEAVSWISASNYIMNAIGFLLIAVAYFLYKDSKKKMYLLLCVSLYIFWITILVNHFSLTFLPLLVIVDLTILERKISVKAVVSRLPLLSLTLFHLIYVLDQFSKRVSYLATSAEADLKNSMPYIDRFPYTIYSNIKLLLFPKTLSIFHEGDVITDALLLLMWLVTILYFLLLYLCWKKKPYLAGLLLFIPVSLVPTFSPILISSYFTERYLYLGNVAFCTLLAVIFLKVEKLVNIKRVALFFTVVLLVLYSFRVIARNKEWSTPKTLWLSTVRDVPNSPRAHRVLGDLYMEELDYTNAAREFEKALELRNGDYAGARNNLGLSYLRLGYINLAEKHLLTNIQQYPKMQQTYLNMSELELNKGNVLQARLYLLKVIEFDPSNNTAITMLRKIDSGEIK